MINLYWNVGQYISKQIESATWGDSVVIELANYLERSEPELKGFSDKNLWRMKQFYEAYRDFPKLSALLREISWTNNLTLLWSKTKKNHPMKRKDSTPSSVAKYMDIAFSWLAYIGRLDIIYTNNSLILNRLFSRKHHKLRYITYPLLKERNEYLQKWEDKGAATTTLRGIAAYQLHLIDYLHVEDGRMISIDEIHKSAESWMRIQKSGRKNVSGIYARNRFIYYTSSWLSYMGQLTCEDDTFLFKEYIMKYLDWLEQDKGYSPRTIEGIYSQLKTLMQNLKVDTLKDITPSILDNFISKRHSQDKCNRRTIASIITVLRGFFYYTEEKGWCNPGLVYSLKAPRVYHREDIPSFDGIHPYDSIDIF